MKRYLSYIYKILVVIVVIYILEFWNYKYKSEIFIFTISAISIFQIVKSFLQKSNNKKIVIKTKEVDWIIVMFFCGIGLFKMLVKNDSDIGFLFGIIPKSIAEGSVLFLLAIATYQRNIIINDKGFRLFDWRTTDEIKFEDINNFKLTNDTIDIKVNNTIYSYRIFKLSNDTIDNINKIINTKCKMTNIA
jgi:hypothetical protein